MQALRIVFAAALALAASSNVFAQTTPAKTTAAAANSNLTMSVGDGTTVKAKNTTVFLGTEYNPNKCVLQFSSLKCSAKDCGELNGFPLECVNVGKQNGVDKKICQCKAADMEVCQNTTAPTLGGVMQFGDCSNGKTCVDSYGHVPTKLELRICAEKIHCVKEVNTTATKPAEICHTCRSCIAQNDAAGEKLTDVKRFDCTKICPQEILDSIAKRNKAGVGIADDVTSVASSSSSSGSKPDESSGSTDNSVSSASKAGAAKKSSAVATAPVSVAAAVVVAVLSLAVLN